MLPYLARRIANYAILLFIATSMAYIMASYSMDPSNLWNIQDPKLNWAAIHDNLVSYNIAHDMPVWDRYVTWLQNVFLHWDWGYSPKGEVINDVIAVRAFVSLRLVVLGATIGLLGGVALVIAALAGSLLGILAAWRRGGAADSVLVPLLVLLGSFPYFWLAMGALYVLGLELGWFPLRHAYTAGSVVDWSSPVFLADVAQHLALPALTIVAVSLGGWALGMRNTMIATASQDYVLLAEAKGLTRSRIMLRYAARNAMLPTVTNIGMSFGFIIGGSMLTEVVFAYPGIGYQLFSAVGALDYPLMQGIFLTITAAVLAANLLVDLVYVRLDPRVRAGGPGET